MGLAVKNWALRLVGLPWKVDMAVLFVAFLVLIGSRLWLGEWAWVGSIPYLTLYFGMLVKYLRPGAALNDSASWVLMFIGAAAGLLWRALR